MLRNPWATQLRGGGPEPHWTVWSYPPKSISGEPPGADSHSALLLLLPLLLLPPIASIFFLPPKYFLMLSFSKHSTIFIIATCPWLKKTTDQCWNIKSKKCKTLPWSYRPLRNVQAEEVTTAMTWTNKTVAQGKAYVIVKQLWVWV